MLNNSDLFLLLEIATDIFTFGSPILNPISTCTGDREIIPLPTKQSHDLNVRFEEKYPVEFF